jgi:hypothetical protein
MSVTGIASSILSAVSGSPSYQSRFQQIRSEFQQLGQDLQSGNLTQAQSDFATLSQNLSGTSQNSTAATTPAATTTAATTSNNSVAQAFAQLGQDLQSGNLQAAQQDFATLQQDAQQNSAQVGGHHHHHHTESSQNSSSGQQTNSLVQDFSQLAQSLQAGNLQGSQSAFSTLQNDLQQIGGFITSGSGSTSGTPAPAISGSLNVTA